jgi:hypothetical protein
VQESYSAERGIFQEENNFHRKLLEKCIGREKIFKLTPEEEGENIINFYQKEGVNIKKYLKS